MAPDEGKGQLIDAICGKLAESPICCDLLLCLFYSAATHYRRATICIPFPPFCRRPQQQGERGSSSSPSSSPSRSCRWERDFEQLETMLQSLPPIHELASDPNLVAQLPYKSLCLLRWILCNPAAHFRLVNLSHKEFERRTSTPHRPTTKLTHNSITPQHIFELQYNDDGEEEQEEREKAKEREERNTNAAIPLDVASLAKVSSRRFNALAKDFETSVAFHASSLENFHSILHTGLDIKFNKDLRNLYGDGIYLSTDPVVCTNFLSFGLNWPSSMFGGKIGAMVGCEVVHDPEFVARVTNNSRDHLRGSDQEGLPQEYIVVKTNDHVRVKYVLILSEGSTVQQTTQHHASSRLSPRNRLPMPSMHFLLLLGLVLLLSLVAFFKTPFWRRLRHQYF